jgi:acetoin utilization deacetylase AcuC-like enzyme
VVPAVAAAFRPTLLVTLHGSDAHAFDPLANLELSTVAFARAARLLDEIAHQYAGGRWLATGGGGYDVYRAVPRNWGLIWLAQAHREVPAETPAAWRERWAPEAARHQAGPPPTLMLDPDGTAMRGSTSKADANRATAAEALEHTLHVLAERHGT